MWSVLACTPPAVVDSSSEDSSPLDSQPADSTTDTDIEDSTPMDTGPFDRDGDGTVAALDCDDDDPDIHPQAEEVWDGYDNDCDGVIDGVGQYTGQHRIVARAWYEGQPHDFELDCPTELDRGLVDVDFLVRCKPEQDDEWAQLLLGSELTIEPKDSHAWELDEWSGDVVVRSSNGWDTTGTGNARWTSMTRVKLTTALDTNYLDFSGSGAVER